MSDTLTNLLQAQHGQSVLQGIANPQLVNPLAAQNSAVQAAGNIYNLRGQQAQQAWGDALQQATDENGNVDYPKAQAIAARMGAVTQMGMMTGLQGASGLQTSQTSNINARMSLSGRAGLSLSVDPSDENLAKVRQDLLANGVPAAQVEANYQRMLAMKPFERQQIAHRLAAGSLDHFMGTQGVQGTGGEFVPYRFIPQQAPGYGPQVPTLTTGGGAIAGTVPAADLSSVGVTVQATQAMVDAALKLGRTDVVLGQPTAIPRADMINGMGLAAVLPSQIRQQYLQQRPGVVNPGNTPVSPSNPARTTRQLNITPAPSLTNQPVFAAPAVGAPSFVPGGGPAPAPAPAPAVPAPVVPAPAARPAPAGRPMVPTNSMLAPDGSVQVASANPLEAPQVGAPSPPNPLVPDDVDAIQAGMQAARDNPRIPGTQTAGAGFTYGPGAEEDATTKLSRERYEFDKRMALDHAKTVLPIAQALSIYGRGAVTTAPGAAEANTARGWVNGVLRSAGLPEVVSSTADFDDLNKALAQVATNSQSAGRSDAALAATLAGNASAHIHEIVGADKMKANLAQIRMGAVANSQWENMTPEQRAPYRYQYSNFLQDFSKTFDLRAGAHDMYTPAQKQTLLDDLKAHSPAYRKQYFDSVDMLRRNGYLGETRTIP